MNASLIFVDTNILVYAHDKTAGTKHERAKACIADLWHGSSRPNISVQVLQELYVNVVRKGVSDLEAAQMIDDYLSWQVVTNTPALLIQGIRCRERWQLSLWDGLIIAAATFAKANTLWSEDLNEGQSYDGVKVLNPLA